MFNIFNIFRKSKSESASSASNKPILRGSFNDGVITLTNHNGVVVCQGDIHDFNVYLRENKISRACIIWSEYDSIKESYWKSRYN